MRNNNAFWWIVVCLMFIAIAFWWRKAYVWSYSVPERQMVAKGVFSNDTANARAFNNFWYGDYGYGWWGGWGGWFGGSSGWDRPWINDNGVWSANSYSLSDITPQMWDQRARSYTLGWRRELRDSLRGITETLRPGMLLEARVKYATYPTNAVLNNHMLLETTQTQVTFLINKGVTKQQLTDAMDKLSQFAFLDTRTNIAGSVYPVFWNTKEQDGNVLGLSLEVQLPGDVKVYIMNKQMLSDTIVGFTYNVGHSSLTIYY
ncbi:MAG: hypothetical protein ACRDDZ_06080 [Marinifilaceae bacterium]